MKKIFIFLVMSIFLISFTSALTFDNVMTYSNNDLKVTIENAFGLPIIGSVIGTMELKSHKSPTEIKRVNSGWGVTMIYETNFSKVMENAIGEVTFINRRNGKEIEKEYRYVWLDGEIKQKDVCVEYESLDERINELGENKTEREIEEFLLNEEMDCLKYEKENYADGEWKPYNSKEIPQGKIILGIEVNNELGEKIDGIWEIQGEKIDKHAPWDVIQTLTNATNAIRSVNFNHDSSLLATGSYDDNVYIYNTSTWTLEETLTDATGYIYSVKVSSKVQVEVL